MEKLTHWKKEANPNYLGSWDLIVSADQNGKAIYRDCVVTITDAKKIPVTDMDAVKKGRMATKDELVVQFREFEKPMIVHAKANFKGLEKATGTPFIERWIGKQVCLYVEQNVKAFGTITDALRIKSIPNRLCSICGKIIDENIYQNSLQKYGRAFCSAECKEKFN